MLYIERILGWSLTAVLLGAIAWSVTEFVSDGGESDRPPPASLAFTDGDGDGGGGGDGDGGATAREPIERAPASPGVAVGPFTLGDDAALDELWQECEAGDGEACDRLFVVSPLGSDYENFGLSCGQRPLVLDCAAELS